MCALFGAVRAQKNVRNPVKATVPELLDARMAAFYFAPRMFGDFCDFVRVSPTRVLFVLLDVAGPSHQNQATVAAAQSTFRASASLLAGDDTNEADAMAELCLRLNLSILKSAGQACSCPAFAGCYNEILGTVCYVNAGHTPGLLRHGTGISELPATSLPLGLFSHLTSDAPIVAVEPGAAFLVASRGLVEAKHKSREFGLDQVKEHLHHTRDGAADDICSTVLDRAQRFIAKPPTHDDMTVLALSRAAR